MARRQPDHIAPPPRVLRRVLLCYAAVVALLVAGWFAWAWEAERRLTSLRSQLSAADARPACCRADTLGAAAILSQLLQATDTSPEMFLVESFGMEPVDRARRLLAAYRDTIDQIRAAASAAECGRAPRPLGVDVMRADISVLIRAAHRCDDDALALTLARDALLLGRRARHWQSDWDMIGGLLEASALRGVSDICHELRIDSVTRPEIETLIETLTAQVAPDFSLRAALWALDPNVVPPTISLNEFDLTLIPPLLLAPLEPLSRTRAAERWRRYPAALRCATIAEGRALLDPSRPRNALEKVASAVPPFKGPNEFHLLEAFRTIAMRRMAAVALALRLYEADHGKPPDALTALVPQYLAALPADPFESDARSFVWTPTDDLAQIDWGDERIEPGRNWLCFGSLRSAEVTLEP